MRTKMALFILALISSFSICRAAEPDAATRAKIIHAIQHSDVPSPNDQRFLEVYLTDTPECTKSRCLTKVFDCNPEGADQLRCRIGYSDDDRYFRYIHNYGFSVLLDANFTVLTADDYDEDKVY